MWLFLNEAYCEGWQAAASPSSVTFEPHTLRRLVLVVRLTRRLNIPLPPVYTIGPFDAIFGSSDSEVPPRNHIRI